MTVDTVDSHWYPWAEYRIRFSIQNFDRKVKPVSVCLNSQVAFNRIESYRKCTVTSHYIPLMGKFPFNWGPAQWNGFHYPIRSWWVSESIFLPQIIFWWLCLMGFNFWICFLTYFILIHLPISFRSHGDRLVQPRLQYTYNSGTYAYGLGPAYLSRLWIILDLCNPTVCNAYRTHTETIFPLSSLSCFSIYYSSLALYTY